MAQIRFLNLIKPIMFLIPEIKAPQKAVKLLLICRLAREINSSGLQLPCLFISSVVRFLFMEFTNLQELIPFTGSELSWLQTEVPLWSWVSAQLLPPV